MRRKFWIAALLSSALSVAALAQMGGRPTGAAPDPAARHEFLAGYLNLSESQKEQVKAIFAGTEAQREQMQGQLQSARQALQAAVKANQPDSAIEQIAATIGNLQAQGIAAQAKQQRKLYSILTDEQQKKLDTFMAQQDRGGRP